MRVLGEVLTEAVVLPELLAAGLGEGVERAVAHERGRSVELAFANAIRIRPIHVQSRQEIADRRPH